MLNNLLFFFFLIYEIKLQHRKTLNGPGSSHINSRTEEKAEEAKLRAKEFPGSGEAWHLQQPTSANKTTMSLTIPGASLGNIQELKKREAT